MADFLSRNLSAWWVTLTFDRLTLGLVRNVTRGVDDIPVSVVASATFLCRVTFKRALD